MIVDHQTHWTPRECLEALIGRRETPRVEKQGDGYVIFLNEVPLPFGTKSSELEQQFVEADAAGVDVLVSSSALLADVLHLPAEDAAEMLDRLNEAFAGAQRDYPERFVGLASLPLQDPDLALKMLERAIGELDLRGVCVLPNIDGRPAASDETLPVFRRIAELGVPVVLHPQVRSATYRDGFQQRADGGIGWMGQTAVAALELIDSGTLDACPGLTVLHPHLGGVLPYVVGRVDRFERQPDKPSLFEYLRTRFYADTVSATPGALRLAGEIYGPDRLLFGSDFPAFPMPVGRAFVEDNLEPDEAQRIFDNRLPGLRLGP
jgi:predicted TIM-barrel fold metal-dependent hydrolase